MPYGVKRHFKPEVCWCGWRWQSYEELILTVDTQRDYERLGLKLGIFTFWAKHSSHRLELSRYLIDTL